MLHTEVAIADVYNYVALDLMTINSSKNKLLAPS